MPRPSHLLPSATRRAFTLVEMLAVIGILAIIIAIVIPTMNKARQTARLADTRSTMVNLSNAISAFQMDNRRDPGYFSPRVMGGTNANGFDTMSNIMLELMGGIVSPSSATTGLLTVGPGVIVQTDAVKVDPAGIGATTQSTSGASVKAYFAADDKHFVKQDQPGQRVVASNDNIQLKSLVDAFGSPILAWAQDLGPGTADYTLTTFAADQYPPGAGATSALFYWIQNKAFLDSSVTSLGKLGEDQTFGPNNGSLLGTNNNTGRLPTMQALLGNPGAPDASAPAATPRPLSARGPIILHAAGPDGVYVGRNDKGGKSGTVNYTPSQDPFNGPLFDDQVMAAGH